MDKARDDRFRALTYLTEDRLTLYARDYGGTEDTNRLPVICLPGLTRNSRDFHGLALLLSTDPTTPRRVITLDYRGRGHSDWDADKANYTLGVETRDVITACEHFGIDGAIFIGTSRGGLILHLLAQMRSDLIAGAILNDIGPKIEAEGLKRIRDYLNSAAPPRDWPEAVAFLKACHGRYFPALDERDWQEMAAAIYRDIDGRLVADFDPAIAAQLQTIDFDQPLPDLWSYYDGLAAKPLMVIRGEHSDLLSNRTTAEMAARQPLLQVLEAPGQGHAPLLHLEPVLSRIAQFLARSA
ncbi:pimeloyl-ACP methyl ester carboxylesterase [Rhizobium tibeticum]|uniref:Pimeloyl-ACP methyl ester carboxylesterase n=1 Tax=Rhizobium tibeticum TaxID=501024 RepID=A0A1H8G974_9HYPH|nr:alpha/beta hydrolase [Rhizobium tibeticum]MDP9808715.1 pimeloyl-ACP methyl ester carboxylesterase [Rhizobium tibeticum]SEH59854.1 Sigma factor SigB regulation protein RsbQ [Rhizobium tibeticum]SEN40067.1 Pimeloyl-ACP methyl ester carboxylesterase [Rhizobium tibeticum]